MSVSIVAPTVQRQAVSIMLTCFSLGAVSVVLRIVSIVASVVLRPAFSIADNPQQSYQASPSALSVSIAITTLPRSAVSATANELQLFQSQLLGLLAALQHQL